MHAPTTTMVHQNVLEPILGSTHPNSTPEPPKSCVDAKYIIPVCYDKALISPLSAQQDAKRGMMMGTNTWKITQQKRRSRDTHRAPHSSKSRQNTFHCETVLPGTNVDFLLNILLNGHRRRTQKPIVEYDVRHQSAMRTRYKIRRAHEGRSAKNRCG